MKAGIRAVGNQILKLECPLCAASVELLGAQLVEGRSVQCPHCRQEAKLVKTRVRLGEPEPWRLIELEFDDERR